MKNIESAPHSLLLPRHVQVQLLKELFIVGQDDLTYLLCSSVTYFNCIFIKYLVHSCFNTAVSLGEMCSFDPVQLK